MAASIRVAHVIGKMIGGGVEQVVMNYYHHIDRERVQFDFLVDADSTLVPRDEIESLGGRVFKVPPYQRIAAYERELERLFRDERWPIVHSHINALSVFPLSAAKRAGVPVRIAHGHSTAGKGEPAKNAAKAVLRHFSNVYPTCRMACSKYAGEWLFGKGAEFEVVYNAFELSRFEFDSAVRRAVRKSLGISPATAAIGHIGRFMTQKNQGFLLDCFREAVRRGLDGVLVFAGEGELKASIENLASDMGISGRVLFLGQRDDVDRLYQGFDLFCLPSLYEGLGIVAVEAQRSGLPCILSENVPAEADVTGTSRFIPLGDRSAWIEAIAGAEAGRRIATSDSSFANYDIEAAASMIVEKYKSLARGCDFRNGRTSHA